MNFIVIKTPLTSYKTRSFSLFSLPTISLFSPCYIVIKLLSRPIKLAPSLLIMSAKPYKQSKTI